MNENEKNNKNEVGGAPEEEKNNKNDTSYLEVESLKSEIEKLKKDINDYDLKSKAAIINARKDAEAKAKLLGQFSLTKLFKIIISFLNDLETNFISGLKNINSKENNDYLEGLQIMLDNLWSELFSQGLSKIDVKIGIDKWNSLYHEFAGRVEYENFPDNISKDLPKDVVVEVIDNGYVFKNNIVIKAVKVKLSSGK